MLEDVANNWIIFSFAWFGLGFLVEVATTYLAKRRERLERERLERERELEWKRGCEMWEAKRDLRQRMKNEQDERLRGEQSLRLEGLRT